MIKLKKNEQKLIHITRLLTPEHRAELLTQAQTVYKAEKPDGNALRFNPEFDNSFLLNQQESSCGNILQRSKK